MFDLITDNRESPLRKRSPLSKALAVVAHVVAVTAILVIPLLKATDNLPQVPSMMAFVAAEPPAPPPPPPPPPPPAPKAAAQPTPQPVKTSGQFAIPVEAPKEIHAEAPGLQAAAGVEGGVEGGIPGGIVGGIVGGIGSAPPPPPPPPKAAPPAPVRVGGQITAPALLKRVEPIYPDMAQLAQLSGIVILEASVGTNGAVDGVKVLRGRHPLLDNAAIEALKQWRYTPLVLNGIPTPFVLTVTFSFSVETKPGR